MTRQIESISKKILPKLREYEVVQAGIFSSFVEGKPRRKGDLDLLVRFQGNKSLLDLIGLKQDLEDILKRPVDVLTYNSVHPRLRRNIMRQQVRIL